MMKFNKDNVVQTANGDTLNIAEGCTGSQCCGGKFLISMFGNAPRQYHQGTFTKEELKKLGAIIARLTNDQEFK